MRRDIRTDECLKGVAISTQPLKEPMLPALPSRAHADDAASALPDSHKAPWHNLSMQRQSQRSSTRDFPLVKGRSNRVAC